MRAIELFAGAGGLGIGVSRAGFRPSLIIERDRWCCETLRENRNVIDNDWPSPTEGDIRAVDFRPHAGVDIVGNYIHDSLSYRSPQFAGKS